MIDQCHQKFDIYTHALVTPGLHVTFLIAFCVPSSGLELLLMGAHQLMPCLVMCIQPCVLVRLNSHHEMQNIIRHSCLFMLSTATMKSKVSLDTRLDHSIGEDSTTKCFTVLQRLCQGHVKHCTNKHQQCISDQYCCFPVVGCWNQLSCHAMEALARMQEEEANEVPRAAASVSDTTASPGTRSIVDTLLQDVVSDNLASSMAHHSMLLIHNSSELEVLPHDIALEPSGLASDYQRSGDSPTAKPPT